MSSQKMAAAFWGVGMLVSLYQTVGVTCEVAALCTVSVTRSEVSL